MTTATVEIRLNEELVEVLNIIRADFLLILEEIKRLDNDASQHDVDEMRMLFHKADLFLARYFPTETEETT